MADLEQEFQSLMKSIYQQIEEKVANSKLTRPEANRLITMIDVRLKSANDRHQGWSASSQECMDAMPFEYDNDDGWSTSGSPC